MFLSNLKRMQVCYGIGIQNGNFTSYLYLQYVPASVETLIIHFKLVFVHESEILELNVLNNNATVIRDYSSSKIVSDGSIKNTWNLSLNSHKWTVSIRVRGI